MNRVSFLIGGLLWAILACLFCWHQSPLALSIFAAGLGSFLGAYSAYRYQSLRLDIRKLIPLGALAMASVNWATDLFRWLSLPSQVLGPPWAYRLSDAAFWFAETVILVFVLRYCSKNQPGFLTAELFCAGGSLVELFAAHRNGFLNRPYAIVDPLWSRGIDPMPAFLGLGCLVAVLVVCLAVTHSEKRGRWPDFFLMGLLIAGLFVIAPSEKLKDLYQTPEASDKDNREQESPPRVLAKNNPGNNQGGKEAQGGSQVGQGAPGDTDRGKPTNQGSSQGKQTGNNDESGQNQEQQGGLGGSKSDQAGQGEPGLEQPNGQGENPPDQSSPQPQHDARSGQGDQTQKQPGQSEDQSKQHPSSGSQGGQDERDEQGGDQQKQGQGNDQPDQGPSQDQPHGEKDSADQRPSQREQDGETGQGGQGEEKSDDRDQPSSENSGRGGNSDDLSFKDQTSSDSQSPPLAVVIFRDDYTPESGMYYFRQNAFSQFNGKKLVADSSGLYDRDIATEFPGETEIKAQLPGLEEGLFKTLDTKVALLTEHAKPFGLTNPETWTAATNPDPKRFQKAYEVESKVLTAPLKELLGRQAGHPDWDEKTWAHYTAGPKDQRYRELLDEIVALYPDAPQNDPVMKALMVKLWLEENGTYSLQSAHHNSENPTADFLFGDRTGYCVYFAHAAVFLYRAAGMPARTGSGYAVEASQRGDGSSLLITSKTAHSWPEVYIDGMGWLVLDISPARSIDPPPPPVDPGLQQMLGEMARQEPEESPPDQAESQIDLQQILRDLVKFLLSALPWLVLGLGILMYLRKLYRRFAHKFCPESELPDASLRAVLDLLADAGLIRHRGEPREVFARRVSDLSPSFLRLTKAHLRVRLGASEDRPKVDWPKLVLDSKAEIANKTPKLRLLRGLFNPINWMRVH